MSQFNDYRVNEVPRLPEGAVAEKGTSAATGPVSAVLSVSTTTAQTNADTNETDLWTYDIPANTLSANGKVIRVTLHGSFGATGNNKTLKMYVGGVALATFGPTAGNNLTWTLITHMVRKGAASEIAKSYALSGGAVLGSGGNTGLTSDTTAAITVKMSGTNGTAAAGDIVFEMAIVEALN